MNRREFLRLAASAAVVAALPEIVLAVERPVILVRQTLDIDEPIVVTEGSVIAGCHITYTGYECAIRVPDGVSNYIIRDNVINLAIPDWRDVGAHMIAGTSWAQ